MAIDPLPTPVPQTTDPVNFDARADALLAALPTMVDQMNATAAAMNAAASAMPFAMDYNYDSTTTAADPGAGKLRFDNANPAAATAVYIDLVDASGVDRTNELNALDDSNSTTKGYLLVSKAGDATKFVTLAIASMTSPAGYRSIVVTVANSSGASPFTNGDALVFGFSRTGDKGDTGPAVPWAVAGGTANALTATYNPAITSLTDGLELKFRAASTITSTTPTFAPNGLTARTIVREGGAALLKSDIIALAEYTIVYNLANTRWELVNPSDKTIRFFAFNTADMTNATGDNTSVTINFAGVRENIGGHFNTGASKFVAPFAGILRGFLHVAMSANVATLSRPSVVGTTTIIGIGQDGSGLNQIDKSYVIELAAGEEVTMQARHAGTTKTITILGHATAWNNTNWFGEFTPL